MNELLKKLSGGDRRSVGKVDEVVGFVNANTVLFEQLLEGLFSQDEVIRMRAADAARLQ